MLILITSCVVYVMQLTFTFSCRIVSTEPLSGFVEMSLRTSSKASSEDKVTQKFSNFQIGDVVSGVIKRIENYGLFIRLINSDVVC